MRTPTTLRTLTLALGACAWLTATVTTDASGASGASPAGAPPPSYRWGDTVTLSGPAQKAGWTNPGGHSLAVRGGEVDAVWQGVIDRGNSDIFHASTHDGGRSWGAAEAVTSGPARETVPAIAAAGNRLYLVWRDDRDDPADEDLGDLYFASSSDGGATWTAEQCVVCDPNKSAAADIAAVGDTVVVVWEDYPRARSVTVQRVSRDGGRSWEPQASLAPRSTGCPILAVAADGVLGAAICRRDDVPLGADHNFEVHYQYSGDGAASWSELRRLTFDDMGHSRFPVIAASGRSLHIAWWDDRDDTTHRGRVPPMRPPADHNFEIYYKRSPDLGASWGDDVRLTFDDALSSHPAVAADGDTVAVAWTDYRDGDSQIYVKLSTDGGRNWGDDVRVSEGGRSADAPSVAVDARGRVYVMWSDKRRGPPNVRVRVGTP